MFATQTTEHGAAKTRPFIYGWLCAAWFTAAISGAVAAEPKLALACAERDLAIVTLIEERGEAGTTPSETLGRAFATQIQARTACAQGKVSEALGLYDRIQYAIRTAGSGTATR